MKIEIICDKSAFELPRDALLERLNDADIIELRVLLAVAGDENLRNDFSNNRQLLADKLNIQPEEVNNALQFWRGAGVLKINGKGTPKKRTPPPQEERPTKTPLRSDKIPIYTGEQVGKLFDDNSELPSLIDECQKIAGKVFNPLEINKITALYDYLKLSSAHILMLFAYCAARGKTSVHYVEKTALNLYDEGVDTEEKFEEYVWHKEQLENVIGKLRIIFGLGTRTLTPTETARIEKWTQKWNFSAEIIKHAYEITIDTISKPSFSYTDKILENWHKAGYTTIEEINNSSSEHKKTTKNTDTKSFDTDEFFEAALKRSYENIGNKPDDDLKE